VDAPCSTCPADPHLPRDDRNRYVKGSPDALLLVEFAGDEQAPLLASIDRLEQLLAITAIRILGARAGREVPGAT